jgi:hypothetical protein
MLTALHVPELFKSRRVAHPKSRAGDLPGKIAKQKSRPETGRLFW